MCGFSERAFITCTVNLLEAGVDLERLNATIDWTIKVSVRARLRVLVQRILWRHGYPPDRQERATVLEQARARDWAAML